MIAPVHYNAPQRNPQPATHEAPVDQPSQKIGIKRSFDSQGDDLIRLVPSSADRVLVCGRTAVSLARQLKHRGAKHVVALTQDHESLENTGPDRVINLAPDADTLPLEAGSFQCILCHRSLELVRAPERAVAHFRRLLAPGGVLLLCLANIQYYKAVLMLARGRWDYEPEGLLARESIKFFTAFEAVRLIEQAGLRMVQAQVWSMDDPALFPRDEKGLLQFDDLSVGPLSDGEYHQYLTQQFVAIASQGADGAS
jgi:SAM-dependent methyltransferase